MTRDAEYWLRTLGLMRHPEGGHFREVYRSDDTIPAVALPPEFDGVRAFSSSIYFLLKGDDFSAFHRLRADEVWHFYAGSPLTIRVIALDGGLSEVRLGSDPEQGHQFQAVIPAQRWFAAAVDDHPGSYALAGCTVAPGFDFRDFEMGKREELIRLYPDHRPVIERLTRESERDGKA